MMNDIGNNAFRIGNAGMANQSSIDEDMSSLEQAGQEILNVLGGGRRSSVLVELLNGSVREVPLPCCLPSEITLWWGVGGLLAFGRSPAVGCVLRRIAGLCGGSV